MKFVNISFEIAYKNDHILLLSGSINCVEIVWHFVVTLKMIRHLRLFGVNLTQS